MVAGNVGVQVFPEALDAVVVGAVGRKEMKLESTLPAAERRLNDLAVVDAIVVQHHMNHPRLRVADQQLLQQSDEQGARLALPLDPYDSPGARVQRPRQVAFLVLA